jgi:hypothetical protein
VKQRKKKNRNSLFHLLSLSFFHFPTISTKHQQRERMRTPERGRRERIFVEE